jgi:exopolysaccharide production protein ExoQ
MRYLTHSDRNRQISAVLYSKITELLFVGLLLVFIYPFFFAISGIDPTLPLGDQSAVKTVYYLRLALPLLCLAITFMYRGLGLFLSLPRAIMIYLMICLTSTIWSINPYDTFKFTSLLFLYILAVAGICHVLNMEVVCKIIVKLLAFLILASVVMAVAFPKYGTHQVVDAFEGIHAGQWRGVFVHKNHLGAAASIGLFTFIFFRRLIDASFGFRLMCIIAAITCLIFAKSAGSWVAICVMLVYYWLIRAVPASGNLLLLIIFGVSGLAYTAFIFFGADLVAVVGRDATLTGRTDMWPLVLDAVWQKPLLGFGYYAAALDFMGPILDAALGGKGGIGYSHNGYLVVLLGTGIVGLVSLLFCIFSVLVTGIGRVKTSAGLEAECFMLLLTFLILSLFFSFFEETIAGNEGTLGALTFLSLTAIPLYLRVDRGNYQWPRSIDT